MSKPGKLDQNYDSEGKPVSFNSHLAPQPLSPHSSSLWPCGGGQRSTDPAVAADAAAAVVGAARPTWAHRALCAPRIHYPRTSTTAEPRSWDQRRMRTCPSEESLSVAPVDVVGTGTAVVAAAFLTTFRTAI